MNKTGCGLKYMIKAISLLNQVHSSFFSGNEDLKGNLTDLAAVINRSCRYLNFTLGGGCSITTPEPQLPKYSFGRKRWCLSVLQRFDDFLSSLKELPCLYKRKGGHTHLSPSLKYVTAAEGCVLEQVSRTFQENCKNSRIQEFVSPVLLVFMRFLV